MLLILQVFLLVIAGRQVVENDARASWAATSYAVVVALVAILFGYAWVPQLAASAVGGAAVFCLLKALPRVEGVIFLLFVAALAAVPFVEGYVFGRGVSLLR